ncbi:SAM-dependent methyltransferase [bacterium]|nr:MAG: SAM-dependent methyltransferase [bacterium]
MSGPSPLASSFRDPSGFVYTRDGVLYRQVNAGYADDLQLLWSSGLYDELAERGLLVPCERVDVSLAATPGAVAVLRPERVPTISYPYEWCFGELKDAALLTLEIARRALNRGIALKDASAYNVQFLRGKPVFIDTLSFERYEEGEPWVAYRQFCAHFLAPLALMAHVDVRLSSLLRTNINGVPLDLASSLLPGSTRLKPGLLAHVHIHGKATTAKATEEVKKARVAKVSLLALLDSLKGTVEGLRWEPKGTQWADYYAETNYTDESMAEKRRLVRGFLERSGGRTCWDLGANTGEFSRIAAELGMETVAWDVDPGAVERAYAAKLPGVLPLLQDLTNPSPDLGWAGQERDSLEARGPVDMVMALALVHHLAIGNNVPLADIAVYFARLGRQAIVEFVPKEDSQVRRLLASRRDVFPNYDLAGFEAAVASHFEVEEKSPIAGTTRTLFRLRRRSP